MLLWIGFAAVTAAVVAALVRPLFAPGAEALDPAAADMAVYRDQLAEIEADLARGAIGPVEAEAARAEVARRLLARAEGSRAAGPANPAQQPAHPSVPRPALSAGYALAAFVPIASIALYLVLGSPALPGRPHEARLKTPAEQASVDDLVAKVEARLRDNPDDGAGWDVLAPVYMMQERHAEAANAYARALRLLGETPKRLAGLAESNVLAGNGIVNETARLAFERLKALDPGGMEPRFWLALAKEQDGQLEAAAKEYRALLAEAPPGAAWKETVEDRLAAVLGQPRPNRPASEAAAAAAAAAGSAQGAPPPAPVKGPAGQTPAGRGPSADDMAAAAQMTPDQRTAMIQSMVDGLAARLKSNGNDLGGWLQLVRAYTVMGRRGDALAALTAARRQFEGQGASIGELDALARSLGLGS